MHSANTRKVIMETFFELVNKKNIDKITVKELVAESGVSRQTFYYHFQDIMDVMEKAMDEALEICLRESLKATTPEEAMLVFLKRVKANRKLIVKLTSSQRRDHFEDMFVQGMKTCLIEMIRRKSMQIRGDYGDLEVAIDLFAHGFVNYMQAKCKQGDFDENQLAKQLCRIMSGEAKVQ